MDDAFGRAIIDVAMDVWDGFAAGGSFRRRGFGGAAALCGTFFLLRRGSFTAAVPAGNEGEDEGWG